MAESPPDIVDTALARAVVYRTLSIGFQPPTGARLDRIGARRGFPVVAAALRQLSRPRPGSDPLDESAARLVSASIPSSEALDTAYWRLFGHTARGPICTCETEYGPDNGFHQPQQLANICGYFLAFGLRCGARSDLRADHISSECEFMDFLNRKEALLASDVAREPQAEETLEVTRQAARTFLRDHLGRFGRALGTRVASEDESGYFSALGHVLLAFLETECIRAGVAAGPVDLVVRPEETDETPMACGSADELIQIQRRP
jgi:TorA maturation chaperone TorD